MYKIPDSEATPMKCLDHVDNISGQLLQLEGWLHIDLSDFYTIFNEETNILLTHFWEEVQLYSLFQKEGTKTLSKFGRRLVKSFYYFEIISFGVATLAVEIGLRTNYGRRRTYIYAIAVS